MALPNEVIGLCGSEMSTSPRVAINSRPWLQPTIRGSVAAQTVSDPGCPAAGVAGPAKACAARRAQGKERREVSRGQVPAHPPPTQRHHSECSDEQRRRAGLRHHAEDGRAAGGKLGHAREDLAAHGVELAQRIRSRGNRGGGRPRAFVLDERGGCRSCSATAASHRQRRARRSRHWRPGDAPRRG